MIAQTYSTNISVTMQIPQFRQRLDYALSVLLPNYSRSQIKNWIIAKKVTVNHIIVTLPKKKMVGGELVTIWDIDYLSNTAEPQNIPLDIVYEDNDIIIINKISNIVVHPGVGNHSGTILNALLYHRPALIKVLRAGIVQRLDKDTTGLMVIAKNVVAYNNLLQLFKKRQIIREYEAITYGRFIRDQGTINEPIRRHAIHRTCMTVHTMGKKAITHYYVIEKFKMYSRVRVRLETGRTHQIRVHMAYINHPLVGDQKYGKIRPNIKEISEELNKFLCLFNRQALHACSLQLYHPDSHIHMQWHIPLPRDMTDLLNMLRENEKLLQKS